MRVVDDQGGNQVRRLRVIMREALRCVTDADRHLPSPTLVACLDDGERNGYGQ